MPYQIECPKCRQITRMRHNQLPKNRTISKLLEIAAKIQMNVTNKTEHINKPEWNENYMHVMFTELDTNRDGKVTFHELYESLKQKTTYELNRAKLKELFTTYDTDADYKINFEEFNFLLGKINEKFKDFLNHHIESEASSGEFT